MDRIVLQPLRRWSVSGWVAAALWLGFLLMVNVASWSASDLGGGLVSGFALAVSVAFIFIVGRRWRTARLYADREEIRLGKKFIRREDVVSIAIEPEGDTPVRFWLGVGTMAVTQDFTKTVSFRDADGRLLLSVPQLYGSAQVIELARFLKVPLSGAPSS